MNNMTVDWKTLLAVKTNHVRKYYPDWQLFWECDERAYFDGWVHTSDNNRYQLRLYLNPRYQESPPQLFVWEPKILRRVPDGVINDAIGHFTHTLSNGPDGRVQICYGSVDYDAGVSYVLPILRGYLWCEAYTGHLQTGKPIADYFPS